MTIESQLKTYQQNLAELLVTHSGKYALVYDGHIRIFDTSEQARTAGYELCGRPGKFLVKQIMPDILNGASGVA